MANLYDVKKGTKGSVSKFILDRFEDHRTDMAETHRIWMLNLAWVRGQQNRDYDKKNRKWTDYNKDKPWNARLIANLMLPVIRRNVAQLVQNTPPWDVIPATTDEKDIQISHVSNKTIISYWQKLEMIKKLIQIAFWQSTCSSAFLKVGWDAKLGDEIETESNLVENSILRQFMEAAGLNVVPKTIPGNEGDLFISTVPPFNLMFDNVPLMEDSLFSIESQIRTKDWIVDKYGTKFKKLDENVEAEMFLSPLLFNSTNRPKHGIVTHELYTKPFGRNKEGLHSIITGAGEVIVAPKDNPYEHKELPYSHFLEIYDPGSLYGTSTAEQIRPQQAKYNRIQSVVLDNLGQMANLQWLNPSGSGVKSFTNLPGRVIHHTAGRAPSQVQPKGLPTYVHVELDRTKLDIQDTASNHDVSEGKAEPGLRSGKAVTALQDADDSIKGPVLAWWDLALARTGRLALQTLAQFLKEDRLLEITGDYSAIETLQVSGEKLRGKSKGDYFKVRVKGYGRQPMSRSAREGFVRVLVEMGLLHPQTDKELLLNIIGASDLLQVFDRSAMDRVRQAKEIDQIKQGQGEKVRIWFGQNHEAHINSIKKFMSGSNWDELDDKIKTDISSHLRQHIEQKTIEQVYPQIFLRGLFNGPGTQEGSGEGASQGTGADQGTGEGI